jgi:hypothetical protein
MSKHWKIALAAVSLCLAQPAAAGEPWRGAGERVVVWVEAPGAGGTAGFDRARSQLREIGVTMVPEVARRVPTVVEAIETLLVHRAMAVIWHDQDGALQVLFEREERPERISATSGDPEEEGLYLVELLRARLGMDDGVSSLLVTAPEEALEPGPGEESGHGQVAVSAEVAAPDSRSGLGFAAGYFARVHSDAARWWQHGIEFAIPSWRVNDLWEFRGTISAGLPSSVGEHGTEWLELRTFGVGLAIGLVPLRGSRMEVALSLGAGTLNTIAVAFLADGESDTQSHLSAEAVGRISFVWRAARRMSVIAFASCSYVMSPPSFSMNGRGDFGRFPWQPVVGLDISVGLFGK